MPPKPAPILAMPQTEPTVFRGNLSAGIASIFASAPVYPRVAVEISAMETYTLDTSTAGIAEVISAAKNRTDILRARTAGTPMCNKAVEKAPPMRLPASAVRNGIQANLPMDARSNPRALFRYCGNQKI